MVDRLDGLRHHPVVGGDDDHGDVGHLGAAGAHRREGLVTRGVEEGDRLAVVAHLVGADVLGDPAGLAGRNLRLADRVEQGRLAVVDVAHHGDDGRPRLEIRLVVLDLGGLDLFLGGGDDLDLSLELLRDRLHRIVGKRLGQGGHLAALHQGLDHLGAADAEGLGDLAHRCTGVDLDRRRLFGRLLRPVHRLLEHGAATAATAAAGRPGGRLVLGDVLAPRRL